MKSKILMISAAFCLLFFTNCNPDSNRDKSAAEGGATDAAAVSSTDLVGYWVNQAWWNELQSTKSPRQAADKIKGITGAIFLQNEAMTTANLSINWHEGSQYAVRTREGKQELYDPNNAAIQTIPLTPQSDGVIRLENTDMVRLGPTIEGAKAVAHALLGGQYDLNGKVIVFNPNGTVVGLEGYNYYDILFDYVVDELGVDQLSLSKDGSNPVFYAFKWEGNHLVISEIEDVGGKDKFAYQVGTVRYDLVKK